MLHQFTAETGPHEGELQELLRAAGIHVVHVTGAQQIDPLLQLSQTQGHNGLMDRGSPVAKGKIGGVGHLQKTKAQAGIHRDQTLDLIHVGFVSRHRHHQLEETALEICAVVDHCGHPLRHIGTLQGVRPHRHRLLVGFLTLNIGDNALLVHAVGDLNGIAHRGGSNGLGVDLDVIDAIHQCQIAGRELKLVDRDPISLSGKLIYKPHRERMDNHTVVDLDYQLRFVKQPGRFSHQKRCGKGHEI